MEKHMDTGEEENMDRYICRVFAVRNGGLAMKTRIKRILRQAGLWTVIALICLAIWTLASHARAETAYYVAVSELNLRKAASTDSDKVAELVSGEPLEALDGGEKGWVKVRTTDGYTGYVDASYLRQEETYEAWTGVITSENDGAVNVRTSPGGKKQGELTPGTAVTVLYPVEADGDTWYRVRYGQKKGFVMAEFVGVDP